jgi:hypothetical protein
MASNLASHVWGSRILVAALVGVCLLVAPAVAHAANNCAWINEATASGLLGGDAVGEVSEAVPGQPTVCTFTQITAGGKRTLRITVEIAGDPHARLAAIEQSCGADAAPMKAIGNEALVCATDDRKTSIGERVVGRVRDQVFTITIASTLKNDPVLTRSVLKVRIFTAAEQVSGNLF